MLPLYLSLGVLSILILFGIVLIYLRVRSMERDLRQFYHELERRPKGEIISIIKGRLRPR